MHILLISEVQVKTAKSDCYLYVVAVRRKRYSTAPVHRMTEITTNDRNYS